MATPPRFLAVLAALTWGALADGTGGDASANATAAPPPPADVGTMLIAGSVGAVLGMAVLALVMVVLSRCRGGRRTGPRGAEGGSLTAIRQIRSKSDMSRVLMDHDENESPGSLLDDEGKGVDNAICSPLLSTSGANISPKVDHLQSAGGGVNPLAAGPPSLRVMCSSPGLGKQPPPGREGSGRPLRQGLHPQRRSMDGFVLPPQHLTSMKRESATHLLRDGPPSRATSPPGDDPGRSHDGGLSSAITSSWKASESSHRTASNDLMRVPLSQAVSPRSTANDEARLVRLTPCADARTPAYEPPPAAVRRSSSPALVPPSGRRKKKKHGLRIEVSHQEMAGVVTPRQDTDDDEDLFHNNLSHLRASPGYEPPAALTSMSNSHGHVRDEAGGVRVSMRSPRKRGRLAAGDATAHTPHTPAENVATPVGGGDTPAGKPATPFDCDLFVAQGGHALPAGAMRSPAAEDRHNQNGDDGALSQPPRSTRARDLMKGRLPSLVRGSTVTAADVQSQRGGVGDGNPGMSMRLGEVVDSFHAASSPGDLDESRTFSGSCASLSVTPRGSEIARANRAKMKNRLASLVKSTSRTDVTRSTYVTTRSGERVCTTPRTNCTTPRARAQHLATQLPSPSAGR